MLSTTVGQLLINEALPDDLKDYNRVIDKKGSAKLFQLLAEKYPEKYKEITQKLMKTGHKSSFETGSFSFGLNNVKLADSARKNQIEMKKIIQDIVLNPHISDKEKEDRIISETAKRAIPLEEAVMAESKAEKNPLYYQVQSGSRGNATNLRSLRGGDMLYEDQSDKVIPIPITRSYSQGLTPAETWAGSYGARKGVLNVKFDTMNAGYLCLAADTLVKMFNAPDKEIQHINVGDVVFGSDMTGKIRPVKVTAVFKNGKKELWKYTFRYGKSRSSFISLTATQDHHVLAKMKRGIGENSILSPTKLPLKRASMGFRLVNADGAICDFIEKEYVGIGDTFDIEVDHPDHLFVLANGIITSNSKQMNQMSHRLIVTAMDADNPEELKDRGYPVKADDADNEGALLARAVGPYKRNTILTPKIIGHIKELGHDNILVRSPIVSGSPEGGVYARDVGVRERGGLPPLADNVGLAASAALSEPVSQSQLCLAKGTLVRMADWTVKAIELIEPGEVVLGSDRFGTTSPVRVLKKYVNGIKDCVRTEFNVSKTKETVELISTPDHKILSIARRWSIEKQIIDKGIWPVNEKCVRLCAVMPKVDAKLLYRKKQISVGQLETFDIEVDNEDHLFVLASGLIVSNSSKHSGGVVKTNKVALSGFKAINQYAQIPKVFKGGATHSKEDGQVQDITEAPAGGHYVTINNVKHYVPVGFDVTVKKGDTVEAGDTVSDGVPNPAEIVDHKGIGEGRRYFVEALRKIYADSNIGAHRRNIELLTRGLINHVELTDEFNGYNVDDVIPYSTVEHNWALRPGHEVLHPKKALNKYLEKPVLHYSIGTKIKPSVVKQLENYGIDNITVHNEPPPFRPMMIRGMQNLAHDPDWLTRMLGSNLEKNLLHSVHHGLVSDEKGTSFVPGLARGVDFGHQGFVRDWHEADKKFKDIGKILP